MMGRALASAAAIGALVIIAKGARHADETRLLIGPTARAVAEEAHTPHPSATDAISAAQVITDREEEDGRY